MKKTIVLILTLLVPLIVSLSAAQNQKNNTISVPVVVHEGQTLWTICEREAQNVGDTRDIREIIYETAAHNKIKSGAIYAGQTIEIVVQRRD